MDDIDLVEPSTIDEARLQMVRQLHGAVHGNLWALPSAPLVTWHLLLIEVTKMQASQGAASRLAEVEAELAQLKVRSGDHGNYTAMRFDQARSVVAKIRAVADQYEAQLDRSALTSISLRVKK